jgi:very-short-patch-repair endonuclease
MATSRTPIQQAERLASQQHAAINRRQALAAGLTPRQIKRLLATGRWRQGPGRYVYVVSGAPATWKQKAALAWLAGPPDTLLSHRTAAALHGLCRPPARPEVTVPRGRNGAIADARVHSARTAPGSRDRRWLDGLPCTDIARTLVDLAAETPYDELCDLVDTALCERKTRPGAILASADRAGRSKGRQGTARLQAALAVWRPGPVAQSVAEMRLARRIEQWGFPPLERQVKIRDSSGKVIACADLGLSGCRIYFEYDGKKGHCVRYWGADDDRDRAIETTGGTILRFNRHDLLPSSTRLRDAIQALLTEQLNHTA